MTHPGNLLRMDTNSKLTYFSMKLPAFLILMYLTQVPFQNHLQSLQLFLEVPNLRRRFTTQKKTTRLCAAAATTRSNSTSSLKFSLSWEFKEPTPMPPHPLIIPLGCLWGWHGIGIGATKILQNRLLTS